MERNNDLFVIKGANEDFKNRRNNVFEQLDVAERNRKNTQPLNEEPMEIVNRSSDKEVSTKSFRGKESIFKKPEAPISKCLPVRRVPDFRKNPHKWTRYSLEDVRDEDISERANTNAAMSFLRELESRNLNDANEKVGKLPTKITFKKSVTVDADTEKDNDNTECSFKSSKVIMPEYVVGQKMKKEKKNKLKRSGSSNKQLKLDHLLDVDDEFN